MKLWLSIIVFILCSCSTQKKAAEKEQRYIEGLQGKYITSAVSTEFVSIPGGMVQVRVRDTVKGKDSTITVSKPCPPILLNLDSLVRKSSLFIRVMLEAQSADLDSKTLRANNQKLCTRNAQLEKWLSICKKVLGGIGVVLAAYIFGRIKKLIP